MPLAWFSQEAEEVYHVCLNCPHISKFRRNNVEVELESYVNLVHPAMALCEDCNYHIRYPNTFGQCQQTNSRQDVLSAVGQ